MAHGVDDQVVAIRSSPLFGAMRTGAILLWVASVALLSAGDLVGAILIALLGGGCCWVKRRVVVRVTPTEIEVQNLRANYTFALDSVVLSIQKRRLVVEAAGHKRVIAGAVDLNHNVSWLPSRARSEVQQALAIAERRGATVLN
jgi:hypothetical protein